MTLADIQALLAPAAEGGKGLAAGGIVPRRACIDSRQVQPGDLFFCIKGERVDGHAFARDAEQHGAVGIVAAHRPDGLGRDMPLFLVDDPVAALGALAARSRDGASARVVGITGTAGKTTAKEMLATVLGLAGTTAKNFLNLNNQIGLPLSILEATGEERFWVFECGISLPRDMDELGAILRPDVGLVLNVGRGHLAGLGSLAAVADYKARLLSYVPKNGTGLYCVDYPELEAEALRRKPDSVGFTARGGDAPYTARYQGPEGEVSGRFELGLDGEALSLVLPWRGDFAAENVIAVAATAHVLGLDAAAIGTGLAACSPPRQRFVCTRIGGLLVIDDTYNANPLSMRRSIGAATALARDNGSSRPLVLVLGEMLELGAEAAHAHREIGREAARARPKAVFWRGAHADDVAAGLREGGWIGELIALDEVESFLGNWRALGLGEAVALFKGSRANRMEDYAEALTREARHAV